MHEMALARNVVDSVIASAESVSANEITEIWLTIGIARDIVDDLFDGLIKFLCRDTIAENAVVILARSPLTIKCNDCGAITPIDYRIIGNTVDCPCCHSENYHLNSGMEFAIDRIKVA